MNQVTSRGCSRAYILCVLWRALQYVRFLRSIRHPVTFPFCEIEIDSWLKEAQSDCSDLEFQKMLGGTDFYPSDTSTFWTSPSHFFTWWKNNVERKSKFLSLLRDSAVNGDEEKSIARQAIALSVNIKNHFERVLNQQPDRNVVIQIKLPYDMPAHMIMCTFDDISNVIVHPQQSHSIYSGGSNLNNSNSRTGGHGDSGAMRHEYIDYFMYVSQALERKTCDAIDRGRRRSGMMKRKCNGLSFEEAECDVEHWSDYQYYDSVATSNSMKKSRSSALKKKPYYQSETDYDSYTIYSSSNNSHTPTDKRSDSSYCNSNFATACIDSTIYSHSSIIDAADDKDDQSSENEDVLWIDVRSVAGRCSSNSNNDVTVTTTSNTTYCYERLHSDDNNNNNTELSLCPQREQNYNIVVLNNCTNAVSSELPTDLLSKDNKCNESDLLSLMDTGNSFSPPYEESNNTISNSNTSSMQRENSTDTPSRLEFYHNITDDNNSNKIRDSTGQSYYNHLHHTHHHHHCDVSPGESNGSFCCCCLEDIHRDNSNKNLNYFDIYQSPVSNNNSNSNDHYADWIYNTNNSNNSVTDNINSVNSQITMFHLEQYHRADNSHSNYTTTHDDVFQEFIQDCCYHEYNNNKCSSNNNNWNDRELTIQEVGLNKSNFRSNMRIQSRIEEDYDRNNNTLIGTTTTTAASFSTELDADSGSVSSNLNDNNSIFISATPPLLHLEQQCIGCCRCPTSLTSQVHQSEHLMLGTMHYDEKDDVSNYSDNNYYRENNNILKVYQSHKRINTNNSPYSKLSHLFHEEDEAQLTMDCKVCSSDDIDTTEASNSEPYFACAGDEIEQLLNHLINSNNHTIK